MKYGYARISTKDQRIDLQLDALREVGCSKIFNDIAKGARQDRPELTKLLEIVEEKDTIVIWKLDRLGRSLHHLVKIVNDLNSKNVGLVSLNDPIDTTTAQGRLMFNVFASLAEFERDVIYERTIAGIKSAKARGRLGGRPKGLSDNAKQKACLAEALYKQNELTSDQIANQLNISKPTMYKYLKYRKVKLGETIDKQKDQKENEG